MNGHFNKLTPAETERLAYLIEEMAEAQHMACKILRHGYKATDPTSAYPVANRHMLANELCDVLTAINLMVEKNDVVCAARAGIKSKYFHHQDT